VLHRIAFPVVSEWCQYRPSIHSDLWLFGLLVLRTPSQGI
jgi:hypothetical protein